MKKKSIILVSMLLCMLFFVLVSNYDDRFDAINRDYENGSAINLDENTSCADIENLLVKYKYVSEQEDAKFVAQQLNYKFKNGLELTELPDLNKRIWQVSAKTVDSIGSPFYKEKLRLSKVAMGINEEYEKIIKNKSQLNSSVDMGNADNGSIAVEVKYEVDDSNPIMDLLKLNKKPRKGVVVRLSQHYLDSLGNSNRYDLAYSITDIEGKCCFNGLDTSLHYSVLPICEGFEYGTPRGTIGGSLGECSTSKDGSGIVREFIEKEHRIRLFDAYTLQNIEEDNTITLRTPKYFIHTMVICLFLFFVAWWSLLFINTRKTKTSSADIISILMLLTGLCLLSMFSINNPLVDKMFGVKMTSGVVTGVLVMCIFQYVNFIKLYQNQSNVEFDIPLVVIRTILKPFVWLVKPFKVKVKSLTTILGKEDAPFLYKSFSLILVILCLPMLIFDLLRLLFVVIESLFKRIVRIVAPKSLNGDAWLLKPFNEKVAYYTKTLRTNNSFVEKCMAMLMVILHIPFLVIDFFYLLVYSIKSYANIKGCGYLVAALVLTLLLFTPLGSEVGGMKVNLNIGFPFQPSEIAKYLIVIFMASFFSVNADAIVKYSEKGNLNLSGQKLKMLSSIIFGIGILLVLYLILGDMGPALVLSFTFIIMYSAIKSKVDLSNLDDDNKVRKILSCDLAMLFYGVVSFVLMLVIGSRVGYMEIFCIAWFVIWIVGLLLIRKQVFESAVMFNFIIVAFIFGGSILNNIPELSGIAERLESRKEMCTNTWGTLPVDGIKADAGENTQVVEGLWGLASGGLFGQGLGNGSPYFIPAFHTDMILESMGEQLGFVGLLLILLLIAMLLKKIITVGYMTSHPFSLYLCLGVAVVTAVQFIIISFGSTGIIPLTGVTVPFLSYGKVSMILNLAAFGVVLSLMKNVDDNNQIDKKNRVLKEQNIKKYGYPISILNMMYCVVTLFIAAVFLYYQTIDRNNTLIRPVYVNNVDGIPVLEYNPRIKQLNRKLFAGNIYDRNGVLIATSDKKRLSNIIKAKDLDNINVLYDVNDSVSMRSYKNMNVKFDTLKRLSRYYPFENHLAFMLGDLNSDIYNFVSERCGYVADVRHMSQLRGYDNRVDDNGNILPKVYLESDEYRLDKWYARNFTYKDTFQLYNYSALLPYLKAGVNSDRVDKANERTESIFALGKIKPEDVYLTIDAQLQKRMQDEIADYVAEKHSHLNKLRVSVVVLDADKGDLLSSALYPMPDQNVLKERGTKVYRDINTDDDWKSYTDMDLGLMFATAPGSTSKVLTGLAAYRKEGNDIDRAKYFVHKKEVIYPDEPSGHIIDIQEAYSKSSNCYFVNLMNHHDLFSDMAYVYANLGVSVNAEKPYGLHYSEPTEKWMSIVTKERDKSIEEYVEYKKSGVYEKMSNRSGKPDAWSWAWGQNGVDATPISMARAMSVVVNDGEMPITRYTLDDPEEKVELLASTENLNSHLKYTRVTHERYRAFSKRDDIGGKTGTPERPLVTETVVKKKKDGTVLSSRTKVKELANDGWYVCFIEGEQPLAVAIRMERLGKGEMSGQATNLMDNVVMKVLTELNYIEQ